MAGNCSSKTILISETNNWTIAKGLSKNKSFTEVIGENRSRCWTLVPWPVDIPPFKVLFVLNMLVHITDFPVDLFKCFNEILERDISAS